MVVEVKPVPFMQIGYSNGARTPSEDALLRRMNAIDEQTKMNQMHAGGAKGGQQIIVPQIYTGASGDAVINAHMASLNKTLTEHQENSKFDTLAPTNSVVKKGGVKRNRKTKKSRSMRKNKNNKRKTMKRKTMKRKTTTRK